MMFFKNYCKVTFSLFILFACITVFPEDMVNPSAVNNSSAIPENSDSSEDKKPVITDENAFEFLFEKDGELAQQAEIYLLLKTPEVQLPSIFQRIKIEKEGLLFEKMLDIAVRYPFEKSKKYWDELMVFDAPAEFQISVIRKYSSFGNREIVYLLSEKIESPYFSVREAACVELEKLRNDRTFSKVFSMALSENPVKRIYASQALYYLYDKRFITVISDMMKDENKSVRLYTLRIISRHKLEELSYLVKSAAQKDENFEVKAAAMQALVSMKNNTALYIFTRNLTDEMTEVRYAAAQGILFFRYKNGIYSSAKQLTVETDDAVKNILIDIHIKLKNGGGFSGLKKIIESDPNSFLRIKAVYAAGIVGGTAADNLLITALSDGDFRVRAEAAAGLSGSRNRQAVPSLLLAAGKDKSNYVRTAAVYSLQNIKSREAFSGLEEIAASENDKLMKKIINDVIQRKN